MGNIIHTNYLLKSLRTQKLLTQQQVANRSFVSKPTYSSWENDHGKIPLCKFSKLVEILEIEERLVRQFINNKLESEIIEETSESSANNHFLSKILEKINQLHQEVIGKTTTLLFFLLFISANILAQNNYTINGYVADSVFNKKLGNATVIILNAADSTLLRHARVKPDGTFLVNNLKSGKLILKITYPDYIDYIAYFKLDDKKPNHDFGIINLPLKARLLNEVIVKGKALAIKIKGDTTEFNARSFVIEPNANVEDLLKQLPGIQIDGKGAITANGKQVNKVLLDGEEFFGNDPTLITKNIRGDMVDKVQLYDKKSTQAEFTGLEDGKSVKTLDIILQQDKKIGYFGKAQAGIGTKKFYDSQAMLNSFKKNNKLAAFATSSNNGSLGLGFQDNATYGSGSTQFGENNMLQIADDNNTDNYNGQGIPIAHNGGVHFDTKWRDKKEAINLNFKMNSLAVDGVRDNLSQNNLQNGIINNNSNENFNSLIYGQSVNTIYESKIDTNTTLNLKFNGFLKKGDNTESFNALSTNQDGANLNKSSRSLSDSVDKKAYNISAYLGKKFRKQGRTISLMLENLANQTSSDGILKARNEFYDDQGNINNIDFVNQAKKNNINNNVLNTNISYTEPLFKNVTVKLNLGYSVLGNKASTKSFNATNSGQYTLLDTLFSNSFNNQQTVNQAGVILYLNKGKNDINFGTDVSLNKLNQQDLFSNLSFKRNFTNWNPKLYYQYNFNSQKQFKINYNGNNNLPTLTQLQPIAVNIDPLNIFTGNPNLKPSFSNKFNFEYKSFKNSNNLGFDMNGSYTFTNNPIVNQTTTDSVGKSALFTANLSNKIPVNFSIYAGFQKMFNNNLNLGFGLSNQGNTFYSVINNQINQIKTNTLGANFSLMQYSNRKYNFAVILVPNYNVMVSSLQKQINNNGWGFGSEANFKYNFPKNISFNTDVNYQYIQKTQAFGSNFNRLILNASINKNLFKTQSLNCLLKANDILNQNIGFSRSSSNNMLQQQQFSTIRRFFMFSLVWNLNKMGNTQNNIEML